MKIFRLYNTNGNEFRYQYGYPPNLKPRNIWTNEVEAIHSSSSQSMVLYMYLYKRNQILAHYDETKGLWYFSGIMN